MYSIPFYQQAWALGKRQFILILQDKPTLYITWFRSLVFAVVLGTLFLNLSSTTASVAPKSGLIFYSLAFTTLQTGNEIPLVLAGRSIVRKHKTYALYRPSALWIGHTLADQVFSMTQVFVFSTIVYFCADLYRSADAFFTFFLFLYLSRVALALSFRTIVRCLCLPRVSLHSHIDILTGTP